MPSEGTFIAVIAYIVYRAFVLWRLWYPIESWTCHFPFFPDSKNNPLPNGNQNYFPFFSNPGSKKKNFNGDLSCPIIGPLEKSRSYLWSEGTIERKSLQVRPRNAQKIINATTTKASFLCWFNGGPSTSGGSTSSGQKGPCFGLNILIVECDVTFMLCGHYYS